MAIKLHRCGGFGKWVKVMGHPCWSVEKSLQETGIEYEPVYGPQMRSKRDHIERMTGSACTRSSSSRTARSTARSRRRWRPRSAPAS